MSARRGSSGRRGAAAARRFAESPADRPSVTERLAVVDRLLDGSIPAGTVWPRATAWILRIALEQTVDELWSRTEPGLARCPMRAQLLALRIVADPPTAARIAALWIALSHAAHHHDYELAPGVAELRRWYEDTARIARELDAIRSRSVTEDRGWRRTGAESGRGRYDALPLPEW